MKDLTQHYYGIYPELQDVKLRQGEFILYASKARLMHTCVIPMLWILKSVALWALITHYGRGLDMWFALLVSALVLGTMPLLLYGSSLVLFVTNKNLRRKSMMSKYTCTAPLYEIEQVRSCNGFLLSSGITLEPGTVLALFVASQGGSIIEGLPDTTEACAMIHQAIEEYGESSKITFDYEF